MNNFRCSPAVLLSLLTISIAHPQAQAQVISFNRQLAAHADSERLYGTAADDSSVYVLADAYAAGSANIQPEVFLRRLDPEGTEIWTRPFGSPSLPGGIALIGSNVYVTGTRIAPGGPDLGGFLRKYDAVGNEVWTRELGGSGTTAHSLALTVHATGMYVGGLTRRGDPGSANAFLRKI
jgi:hypothetical protein